MRIDSDSIRSNFKSNRVNEMINTSKNKVLIDDGIDNVNDWDKNGGKAILFQDNLKILLKKKVL